ncbi:hypothetical protein D9756_006868 [Leucocoprinus leucothites]|uniref:Uncharacterized protein n=1 Tax=Leucocoprinus leucothites TaxID=201217 RepID=A0A8H5LH28_9AGAR|nr:hypothetical protein D9756_006868 [Leucoagaricus leucothites]
MAGLINRTFDDRDPQVDFTPDSNTFWILREPTEGSFYNNTTSVINSTNWSISLVSVGLLTLLADIEIRFFARKSFPEMATGVYAYGQLRSGMFHSALDCSPSECSHFDSYKDNFSPPVPTSVKQSVLFPIALRLISPLQDLLFTYHFDTPEMHNLTLFGDTEVLSDLWFDRFDLEIPTNKSGTSTSGAILSQATSSEPLSSPYHHNTPVGGIVGGCVGGLVILLGLLIALFFYYRRKRTRSQKNTGAPTKEILGPFFVSSPFIPPPKSPFSSQSTIIIPTERHTVYDLEGCHWVSPHHEVDAGPVILGHNVITGGMLPPQYEQVFTSSTSQSDLEEPRRLVATREETIRGETRGVWDSKATYCLSWREDESSGPSDGRVGC